ncbi:acyl-CoA dehydrogenase family protein [Acrocarpospora catenulata]|uniref:acyl-CoA dehydrogenase family protein n=1 Tax=Acrocarpospora catenulata TaxID=2836182 RepID=UPI001BDB11EB|nr:acyl-CoA dehydrogenase family protein [Acrocarpospora catenulata]
MSATLVPTEIGVTAAEAIRDLCARAVGGTPVAEYAEAEPLAWEVLEAGGWDLVGAPEADGGGDATLLDLVLVARAWGETIVPAPFLTSLMAKRWSVAARDCEGPVTFAVADPSWSQPGHVPFGTVAPHLLRSVERDEIVPTPVGKPEPFAPSLRATTVGVVSELTAQAGGELAVVWAAEATGCAERLLAMSVAYAKERHQFDRPIGSFQAVKHTLSSMKVLAETAETAVLWAAIESGHRHRAAAWALDASLDVAERAVQVHGGMGFTWEMGLHFYLRHITVLRQLVRGLPR